MPETATAARLFTSQFCCQQPAETQKSSAGGSASVAKSDESKNFKPSHDPTHQMAEAVGFEPTKHCCSLVFKTSSIGRSDRPPLTILVRVGAR